MKAPSIQRDAVALAGVLLEELEAIHGFVDMKRALAAGAIRLLDEIVLASAGFDRAARLDAADAELALLRARLDLARALDLFDDATFLELMDQADVIGRQIGGWLGKLRRDAHASSEVRR